MKTSDNEYERYYEILVRNDMTKKRGSFVFQINLASLYHYLGKKGLEPRWSYEAHVPRLGNMILLVSGRQVKGKCVMSAHHCGPETADLHPSPMAASLHTGILTKKMAGYLNSVLVAFHAYSETHDFLCDSALDLDKPSHLALETLKLR